MKNSDINWFENIDSRPHPWPGLMWLTPMLVVPDVEQARDFYTAAFGFVSIFEAAGEGSKLTFVRMRYRGSNFTLNQEGFDFEGTAPAISKQASPLLMYLYVDDVESVYRKALDNKAEPIFSPTKAFWGDLRARIKCPAGYWWDIAQRVAEDKF